MTCVGVYQQDLVYLQEGSGSGIFSSERRDAQANAIIRRITDFQTSTYSGDLICLFLSLDYSEQSLSD